MLNPALHNPHLNGEPFYWENGPVGILLLHGLTATPVEVRLLGEQLHRRGFTVAGPLLPGHGTTPQELNHTPWQTWAGAGEESYRQIAGQCERVFVGGESTGALVALHLAANHPEIAGVLAYSPALKLAWSRLDIVKVYLGAPFIPSVPKENIDVSEGWQGYPVNPLKSAIQLHKFQFAVRKRLAQIKQPVLVMQGRLDTTIHPSCGDMICHGVSSSVIRHYWLEKSTHVVILDRELDQITHLTVEFINQVLGAQ